MTLLKRLIIINQLLRQKILILVVLLQRQITKQKSLKQKDKIHYTNNLATKTALTTVKNKIPDTSNLATKTALNNVENKIPDTNSLVKKSDYNIEIAGIKLNTNKL